MTDASEDASELTKWDPEFTQRVMSWLRPLLKAYHRIEVRGLEALPSSGALIVSNHSGGLFAIDVPVFASEYYEHFGYDRPVYTLSHDMLLSGPQAGALQRTGFIRASHDNAEEALRSGGLVVVFPGGDHDVYRPTRGANRIDFAGRKGYVKAAVNAGVPIVPAVGIGGQETQLFLSRGTWLAKALRVDRLMRVKIIPLSFGLPFGLSAVLPLNLPMPSKIVIQVLPPIDVVEHFGDNPDIDAVDAHVRSVMQEALDELAGQRRLPVIG